MRQTKQRWELNIHSRFRAAEQTENRQVCAATSPAQTGFVRHFLWSGNERQKMTRVFQFSCIVCSFKMNIEQNAGQAEQKARIKATGATHAR